VVAVHPHAQQLSRYNLAMFFLSREEGLPFDRLLKAEWSIYLSLIALTACMALVVLITIVWRRYNKRIDQSSTREPREDTDIWREAAGRWRDDDQNEDDDDNDQRQLDR
jgi:hypothetical protein